MIAVCSSGTLCVASRTCSGAKVSGPGRRYVGLRSFMNRAWVSAENGLVKPSAALASDGI